MSAKAKPRFEDELEHEGSDTRQQARGKTLMDRLMEIRIDGPEDFSTNFEFYASGVKSAKADLR